jgi:urease accessory protein
MRAVAVKRASSWSGDAADSIVLDYDDRNRRRLAMKATRGLEFLLDMPEVTPLHSGDALVLEDGRLVEVVAAPEPLLEIRGADPLHLARLAWHLGNRHLAAQIMPKAIRVRRDHVIAEMARGLGAKVTEIEAPFDPEGGAYDAHAAHDHHDHGHHHHGHSHD